MELVGISQCPRTLVNPILLYFQGPGIIVALWGVFVFKEIRVRTVHTIVSARIVCGSSILITGGSI